MSKIEQSLIFLSVFLCGIGLFFNHITFTGSYQIPLLIALGSFSISLIIFVYILSKFKYLSTAFIVLILFELSNVLSRMGIVPL